MSGSRLSQRLPRRGVCVAVALGSLVAYLLLRWLEAPSMVDLATYRAEGAAIRHGHPLYASIHAPGGLLATYPPFAALVFVPLSFLSWTVTQLIGNAVDLALVGVVAWLSCRFAGVDRARLVDGALLLAGAALWCEPVFDTLSFGQVNLAVVALVLADFARPPGARGRGVGIGLAAAIKVAPGIFVVYLLVTGRYRMARNAIVTFVVTVLLSGAVDFSDTKLYWTKLLFDTGRVGDIANGTNQTVQGAVARLSRDDVTSRAGTVGAFVTLVLLLVGAALVYRRLGDRWGLTVAAVAGLLASPISWSHHWVWCVPMLAVAATQRSRAAVLAVGFWLWLPFAVSRRATDIRLFPTWELLWTNWYVVFGASWVVAAVVKARRVVASPVPERLQLVA
ncbi:glycosyltransferase 87 family protein [uncultured Jatrophihabitans sp.]|uniref:glycosyltransferase 87 family protein n=1 Tax=uncultured Jatrophihabitans sp. TaxID=1610747 RepID=UPI0035C9978A